MEVSTFESDNYIDESFSYAQNENQQEALYEALECCGDEDLGMSHLPPHLATGEQQAQSSEISESQLGCDLAELEEISQHLKRLTAEPEYRAMAVRLHADCTPPKGETPKTSLTAEPEYHAMAVRLHADCTPPKGETPKTSTTESIKDRIRKSVTEKYKKTEDIPKVPEKPLKEKASDPWKDLRECTRKNIIGAAIPEPEHAALRKGIRDYVNSVRRIKNPPKKFVSKIPRPIVRHRSPSPEKGAKPKVAGQVEQRKRGVTPVPPVRPPRELSYIEKWFPLGHVLRFKDCTMENIIFGQDFSEGHLKPVTVSKTRPSMTPKSTTRSSKTRGPVNVLSGKTFGPSSSSASHQSARNLDFVQENLRQKRPVKTECMAASQSTAAKTTYCCPKWSLPPRIWRQLKHLGCLERVTQGQTAQTTALPAATSEAELPENPEDLKSND